MEFAIDAFHRECLLHGWDNIQLTLKHEDLIAAYEQARDTPRGYTQR